MKTKFASKEFRSALGYKFKFIADLHVSDAGHMMIANCAMYCISTDVDCGKNDRQNGHYEFTSEREEKFEVFFFRNGNGKIEFTLSQWVPNIITSGLVSLTDAEETELFSK